MVMIQPPENPFLSLTQISAAFEQSSVTHISIPRRRHAVTQEQGRNKEQHRSKICLVLAEIFVPLSV